MGNYKIIIFRYCLILFVKKENTLELINANGGTDYVSPITEHYTNLLKSITNNEKSYQKFLKNSINDLRISKRHYSSNLSKMNKKEKQRNLNQEDEEEVNNS